jgi:peptidoglycan/xylan/chitin deacetylase (PgdA/CDA1 family)
MKDYPRDLIGYGRTPPDPQWPGDARIAVQIVLNYEEGGEACILHGDSHSESYLQEVVGSPPLFGVRNPQVESIYEYGSRSGFWRLLRLFREFEIPVTIFGVAMALERNPEAVSAIIEAGYEIASHGWRWIDYQFVSEERERAAPIRAGSWSRRADSSTIPTPITTICPIGWSSRASRTSLSPTRSTSTI